MSHSILREHFPTTDRLLDRAAEQESLVDTAHHPHEYIALGTDDDRLREVARCFRKGQASGRSTRCGAALGAARRRMACSHGMWWRTRGQPAIFSCFRTAADLQWRIHPCRSHTDGEQCTVCTSTQSTAGFWLHDTQCKPRLSGASTCSSTSLPGTVVLMVMYGYCLLQGANILSDGSEMLLEVLDPGLIGGRSDYAGSSA